MKVSVFIFGLLSQAFAASLYDEFRGAISDVERGFGKLITDVVTDFKDTIHCTLSAVEQVLVLKGVLDKTSAYNYRCRDNAKQKSANLYRAPFDRFKKFPSPHEFSTRQISMELENSKTNTNKTIEDILKRSLDIDKTYPSKVLQDETHRLVEISDLLKNELEKLSNNVRKELTNRYIGHRSNSVDSLWSDIKALHDMQRTSDNDVEIKEIRHVLDKVVNRLDLTPNYGNNAGNNYIDDIKKQLQWFSKQKSNDQLHGDEGEQNLRLHGLQFRSQITNDMPKSFKEAAQEIINHNAGRRISENLSQAEKSIFDINSDDFDSFSPFSYENSYQKNTIDNAKKIIQDSKHTDQVLNQFFQNHNTGVDAFSDSKFFNFG